MIITKRNFQRAPPSRDAKSFYVFCEGNQREPNYLAYFNELNSKINVVPIPSKDFEDNSPAGLFEKAHIFILRSDENPDPRFELLDIDEVWFVIDTDKWGQKITDLRYKCGEYRNWYIAQSNPCFEVWLYYHFYDAVPIFEGMNISKNWKIFTHKKISGGFDHRKHPIYLSRAIQNAKSKYIERGGLPGIGHTEMFKLGEKIYELVEETLEAALKN